ncbi:hypothetical protein [Alicyclobacillus sendaiensis]|uniref:hypothetical protein n=1 Tax=Alicyclobacillus sendaiensis TaxID=192387 RepID=UPI00272C82B7|nr:hypothetical protein [Alicyclobacillus sendaiensis]
MTQEQYERSLRETIAAYVRFANYALSLPAGEEREQALRELSWAKENVIWLCESEVKRYDRR